MTQLFIGAHQFLCLPILLDHISDYVTLKIFIFIKIYKFVG